MVKIREAIVVEGKYDKNTLSQIVETTIIETSGFGIMKDEQQMTLLRKIAKKRGLIVFTDSDGAGFVIRNRIKSAIEPQFLKHAYIPDIYGKERRKVCASKEGKIGVEGMTRDVLIESLHRAGATFCDGSTSISTGITKYDLVELGLSGGANSSAKRKALLMFLGFPTRMSTNAMLQAFNLLYTKDELMDFVHKISMQE